MKIKVRIALAVAPDGQWNCAGWCMNREISDKEKMDLAVTDLPTGEAHYFLEAWVDVPNVTIVDATVIKEEA